MKTSSKTRSLFGSALGVAVLLFALGCKSILGLNDFEKVDCLDNCFDASDASAEAESSANAGTKPIEAPLVPDASSLDERRWARWQMPSWADAGGDDADRPVYVGFPAEIKDQHTNLTWSKQVKSGTPAGDFCDATNQWYLPTRIELVSLLAYSDTDAGFIDRAFGPTSGVYWTSSTFNNQLTWAVDFSQGTIALKKSNEAANIRCVKFNNQSGRQYEYFGRDDVIISDVFTHLRWQRGLERTKTHAEAITYCESLSLANVFKWRLPTIKELATLVDDVGHVDVIAGSEVRTLIDGNAFPDTPTGVGFWSSTAANDDFLAMTFRNGTSTATPPETGLAVRCVSPAR